MMSGKGVYGLEVAPKDVYEAQRRLADGRDRPGDEKLVAKYVKKTTEAIKKRRAELGLNGGAPVPSISIRETNPIRISEITANH